jgi:hypothetical protein
MFATEKKLVSGIVVLELCTVNKNKEHCKIVRSLTLRRGLLQIAYNDALAG